MTDGLLQHWRVVLQALDPQRALRSSEVEGLYAPRKGAPSDRLANHLRLEAAGMGAPDKVLLCGARGSGKTTELVRLGHLLREDFVPIRVDLAAALPNGSGTVPLLAVFAMAGLHALREWTGPDADLAPPSNRLATALGALSSAGSVAVGLGELVAGVAPLVTVFGLPGATTATAAGMAAGSIGLQLQRLRDFTRTLGGDLDPARIEQARDLVATVNDILDALRVAAGRPALLLADGLDKQDELEDVLAALSSPDLLERIAAPLVLTGPVNLRHDPRFTGMRNHFRTHVLYNLAVRTPAGEPNPEGVAVLVDLYRRRQVGDGLPANLVAIVDLERAAAMSAGIVRDFLGILYDAGLEAYGAGRRTITAEDVDAGVRKLRHMMQMALNSDRIRILAEVLRRGVLPPGSEASQLLFENYVACYPNGDVWYRPHEVLVAYVERTDRALRDDG